MMYVITFYSYKGGVGRSMALANTAFELAQTGRKVLIVDFDLEAPGLLDFNIQKPEDASAGLVEFVSDYLSTGAVPDADRYLFKSNQFAENGGGVFVMPAGRLDETYQERFSNISWSDFYSENNGFLVMEDLRLQWSEKLHFDYVLIDSRTGYTDIAGICTRQLPDAVCLVFSPNKQNLAGIKKIRQDIVAQREQVALRQPVIHFVASNIPNLGDDNGKLDSFLKKFQDELSYEELSAKIHHYSSFALLEQEIFTWKLPNTILSEEYRKLAGKLAANNLRDKLGVLDFLGHIFSQLAGGKQSGVDSLVDEKINTILKNFSTDPDVILACARIKRLAGDVEHHRELLEVAIELGSKSPRAFLELAVYQEREDNGREAWRNILTALQISTVMRPADLTLAIRLGLRQYGDSLDLDVYLQSSAVQNMSDDDVIFVCTSVNDNVMCSRLAIRLLNEIYSWQDVNQISDARILLGNAYICVGDLRSAIHVYTLDGAITHDQHLVYKFNLGMAMYWSTEQSHRSFAVTQFEEILSEYDVSENGSPNKEQCFAFMLWATGQIEKGKQKLDDLMQLVQGSTPVRFFSCWRYHVVNRKQAVDDLIDMARLFDGLTTHPKFVVVNSFDEE